VLMVKPDSEMQVYDIVDYEILPRPVDVKLRKSQVKFPSTDLSLNVVRCATYSQGYLNRQLIILLSCLGVPDEVFLNLQREAKTFATVKSIY